MSAPASLPSDLGSILAADLRFFQRWPGRDYRLRLAGLAELSEIREKFGSIALPADPSVRAFCAVRRVGSHGLYRVAGFAIDCGEPGDFPEATARIAYAVLATASLTAPINSAALWRAAPSVVSER